MTGVLGRVWDRVLTRAGGRLLTRVRDRVWGP